jgi:hypothetical protein
MDGCPIQGDVVLIRLYLSGVDLTPSYKNINNRLQVKYFTNLVLLDEDNRKYFKQHDIEIYHRKWCHIYISYEVLKNWWYKALIDDKASYTIHFETNLSTKDF